MEEYFARVAKAASERNGEPIYNGSLDHARIIAEALFKHAQKSVDVYCGELNARVFGPDRILDEAEQFLASPNHSVRILVENKDVLSKAHPFIARLNGRSNMEYRHLPSDVAKKIGFHAMVVDGDSYRFEADKRKYAAVAAWGDGKGAGNLQRIFNSLWDLGVPVFIS
jgi:hypothetical protein